jgi:hypothetical protein
MIPSVRLLFCLMTGALLCQCSSSKKKDSDPVGMTLEQRSTQKPDASKRSRYEKYMNDPKMSKSSAGSFYQKQLYHSKNFEGGGSYAGQKQFKTSQSVYGRSKASGIDMTYALGKKQAAGMNSSFKTDVSRLGSQQARESNSVFSGADSTFKTKSALTRSQNIGKPPNIIENYNDRGGKKSAYSEDEVRKLLNRN